MFSREINPGLGRAGRVRPNLETLEDRCCPSTTSFNLLTHVLTLTGDASNSTIVVRDDGLGDMTVYGVAGYTATHPLKKTGVAGLTITSTTGSDHIDYALTGVLAKTEAQTLNLGKGNDQVKLDFSKGVKAPSLSVKVNGGLGNQTVNAVFGPITNTQLRLAAVLGDGIEHFNAQFNGGLAGTANADVNVKGGKLIDGINIAVNGNIATRAKLSVETSVVGRTDTIHADYTGQVDGVLSVQETAGAGWDWLESTIKLAGGSTGSVTAKEQGGTGFGFLGLTVTGTTRSLVATISKGIGHYSTSNTANVKVTK